MKSSGTTGFDEVSSRFLKEAPELFAVYITHLINSSIRASNFPEIFKISRIIPISKPGKPTNSIDSFRPISNLNSIEKVYEEWIKCNLMEYLNLNEIILEQHHGGLPGHSTLTAKSMIDYHTGQAWNENQLSVVLTYHVHLILWTMTYCSRN